MSTMVTELYRALRSAGVDAPTAEAASSSVMTADRVDMLATKVDLADLRSELIRWMAGLLLAQVGIFAGLVKLIAG